MSKELESLEESSFVEDDSAEVPPSDIVAYNELRSCADLFRMKTEGLLEIQPEFQREFVWRQPDQTRFIDSLIKQLPIPSMCFSLDFRTQKWKVIDGLQRMATICRFLSGEAWRLSKLEDVDPKISGQQVPVFHDRSSDLHLFFLRVQNLSLPITVLRCDYTKRSHTRYLFTIFHRLNTGGMKLNNQEIRNCIYAGRLNDLLRDLNDNDDWLRLNKLKKASGHRFLHREIILRMFALMDSYKSYGGRLARFLNDYMDEHKNPTDAEIDAKRSVFERTVSLLYRRILGGVPPPKQPMSVLEAVLVGVALNIDDLERLPDPQLRSRYQALLSHEEFSETKLLEGLSGKQRVIGRIEAGVTTFRG